MNKTAIKNFAVWARNKLLADVRYRAGLIGITEKGIADPLPQSTSGTKFFDIGATEPYAITGSAIHQRERLVEAIQKKKKDSDYATAYKYILEEVAYTWFNRLIAIRFMEVNDYLPSHIRVLSSESGKMEPDLVTTPFDAELEFSSDEETKIISLKQENKLDEVFRILFIKQCNALNEILPALFEKTENYTELLLNLSVIDQDGVVYHLIHDIPEDDFNIERGGQVEIIGWLYQYYNTEPKAEAFAKKSKITKEEIPAVTQLFTPDWIVRYMVENSLGRLWVEGHPEYNYLKENWKYYLEEAEQEPEVQEKLVEIRKEYSALNPEDIKLIDPCMGSGHILVYAFDVLMQIYESAGYSEREAAKSILENNIYGLDIDDRAYQLAYFAVMMKARQYNRRVLNGENACHVYAIQESNSINRAHLKYFGTGMNDIEKNAAKIQLEGLLDTMTDAKEYGSILNVESYNWDLLRRFVAAEDTAGQISLDSVGLEDTTEQLNRLVDIGETMARKYWVTVTNPPYMGSNGMNPRLSSYVESKYNSCKSDMFAVFVQRCRNFTEHNGMYAMITQPSLLFLASFEKIRQSIVSEQSISSLLYMGRGIFGIDFGSTAFAIRNTKSDSYVGNYYKLHDRTFQYIDPDDICALFCNAIADSNFRYDFSTYDTKSFSSEDAIDDNHSGSGESKLLKLHYITNQKNYLLFPGTPIAFWATNNVFEAFNNGKTIRNIAYPCEGIKTGDNERFLRYWFEVSLTKTSISQPISISKWCKIAKGGPFRKWYGNLEYVINWENNGTELKKFKKSTVSNEKLFFTDAITWSYISAGKISMRTVGTDVLYNNKGPACYCKKEDRDFLLGLCNSNVFNYILGFWAPTMDFKPGNIAPFPLCDCKEKRENVAVLSGECTHMSRADWDSYETSWDFMRHPMLNHGQLVDAYTAWKADCESRFLQLKANEEELNRIFIDIYGLQEELTPDVADKDVTVHRVFDTKDDVPESMKSSNYVRTMRDEVVSLISYAVGCMFGRYSLDIDGLAYAGGAWDCSKYATFIPDEDNCIPITDEEYFEDDIVGLFCSWLKKVYGEDTLEENLDFIANALGTKGKTSREIIRNYFLTDFIKDHNKTYQKRPIYWLFDSGKQNGFKALIYMHRYNADTVGNMRVEYLHRMQHIYESEINRMQDMMDHSDNAREVAAASKRKEKLGKQLKECREYDEKISHLALSRIEIDLDDGVKYNYRKVQIAYDGKFYEVLADSKNIMMDAKKYAEFKK